VGDQHSDVVVLNRLTSLGQTTSAAADDALSRIEEERRDLIGTLEYTELLDLLFTHADLTLDSLLQSETFNYAKPELEEKDIDAEFAEFTL